MKTYGLFLKTLGIILLVLIGLAVVVALGFLGFAIDFGNAWSGSGSGGVLNMIALPLGFVCIVGLIVYALAKRSSARRESHQKEEIRQQVYKEQGLGTNRSDVVVAMLAEHGGMTANELSQKLGIDEEETLKVIRELLQAGSIEQDLTQQPSRFQIPSQGSNGKITGFTVVEILAFILVVLLLLGIGWYVLRERNGAEANKQTQVTPRDQPQSSEAEKVDPRETYDNDTYGIHLKYPEGWYKDEGQSGGLIMSASFSSPDFVLERLDNGYRIDAGGAFYLWVGSLGPTDIDPAYVEAAKDVLGKSTIDSTADYIKLIENGRVDYRSYESAETIDGVDAGRGRCGHYTHGPCVYWVKDSRVYMVIYDGPAKGFAVEPAPGEIGKYNDEFEAMLQSITLD